ncbi:MAG: hypothetical protein KC421_01805 [Anaerolineales bacterium]|nr:hypothetical protein [Anaerolineales bacterium]
MYNLKNNTLPYNKITTFTQQFDTLLRKMGSGITTTTAYDTAWAARLHTIAPNLAYEALLWLRHNQLADGSWGASELVYHHERAICTLAAIIALAENGRLEDQPRIEQGVAALYHHLEYLEDDPSGETIAFEMLLPTLMAEARALGIVPKGDTAHLHLMQQAREAKLARSPGKMISRHVTMAFSTEMAGRDGLHLLDTQNLQEINGSVGYSPSATAYFLLYIDPDNVAAKAYLQQAFTDGGLPNVATIDVFERAWVLWNLALSGMCNNDLCELAQPHLDHLEYAWTPGVGAGTAVNWTLKDGDGTSMVYEVLKKNGRVVDLDGVHHYENETHFRCFQFESNPSISTNIHAFGALRQSGLPINHPTVQKVRSFLKANQTPDGYWIDKWHASPYYPTSHIIIACAGYDDALVERAIKWLLDTQKTDGSWGYYTSTAEETAYSLQALSIWKQAGYYVSPIVFEQGLEWLIRHQTQQYPPLWIGKCLYSPTLVIQSSVISALILAGNSLYD